MTDESLRQRCKDPYSRMSCQFFPVTGDNTRKAQILSYLQLTHRDRQPVRTEVTKTKNARAISDDRNACLADVGPGGENFTYPALVPDRDIHALWATPDMRVVSASITNLDNQTATK